MEDGDESVKASSSRRVYYWAVAGLLVGFSILAPKVSFIVRGMCLSVAAILFGAARRGVTMDTVEKEAEEEAEERKVKKEEEEFTVLKLH